MSENVAASPDLAVTVPLATSVASGGELSNLAVKCPVPEAEPPLPTSPRVELPTPFVDLRGSIHNLLLRRCGSVVLIHSGPRSTRANHWHREDWHYCYVLEGTIIYLERPVGDSAAPKMSVFHKGDEFFTGPNIEHEMIFTKATSFLTMSNRHRSHEEYEADLVRIPPLHTLVPDFMTKYDALVSRNE